MHYQHRQSDYYIPEDVPTVLRRMFSDAMKLGLSWEADGNKFLENFEHGQFITEALDEWAYNFSALADEYESIDTTCVICGTECPVTLVRWGDHVGQLSPKQADKQIPACKNCIFHGDLPENKENQ